MSWNILLYVLQFHTIIDLILNMCPATFSPIVVLTRISQRNWMMWRQFSLLYKYSNSQSIQQKTSWLTKWLYYVFCWKKESCLLFFSLSVNPSWVNGLTVDCVLVVTKATKLSQVQSQSQSLSLSTNRHCGLERKASSGNNGVFDNLPLIFCELNFERINTEGFIIVALKRGWMDGYIWFKKKTKIVMLFRGSMFPWYIILAVFNLIQLELWKYFNEN